MSSNIDSILLDPAATIRSALEAMEREPKGDRPAGIAFVVNGDRRLLGVVTDGDIRRAMLEGRSLDDPIVLIATKDPLTVRRDQLENGSHGAVLRHVRRSGRMADITHGKLAVVDGDGKVVDLVSLVDLMKLQSVRTQTICIVGMGYVGLTLAVAMAEAGLTVCGVEADDAVRTRLSQGEVHFYEAGLARAFRSHLGDELVIGKSVAEATADVYIVCVGTPVDRRGQPVLGDVRGAARSVGSELKRGDLVVLRSTVPVGTCRDEVIPVIEQTSGFTAGVEFDFAYAPERTIAGNALVELRTLPQILGGVTRASANRAAGVFRELTPSIVTVGSIEEAEAVKLIDNAFRDHIFAFSNEIALLCERWGIDTARLIQAANDSYPRHRIPAASPGVGGACLTKDPYLLLASARKVGYEPVLLGRSRRVNESMAPHIADTVTRFLVGNGKEPTGATVFVAGFAFKGHPETSDLRGSPALDLVAALRGRVARIRGYDPVVNAADLAQCKDITFCTAPDGFRGADCAIVMNNHASYPEWDIAAYLASMNRPALFLDGWHQFEPTNVCKTEGIVYGTLGIQLVADAASGKLVRPPIHQTVRH